MILAKDEKIHVIERRYFDSDLRRHFAGTVLDCSDGCIRAKGFIWVHDVRDGSWQKKPEERTRIIHLGSQFIVNVLPVEIEINQLKYVDDGRNGLALTDGKGFRLDFTEFSALR